MKYGAPTIIACPFCKFLMQHETLLSQLYYGPMEYWSDIMSCRPLLPDVYSEVVKCGGCKNFFLRDTALTPTNEEIEEVAGKCLGEFPENFYEKDFNIPELPTLTPFDLNKVINSNLMSTKDQELSLRIELLHKINDRFRRPRDYECLNKEIPRNLKNINKNNLLELEKFLDESIPEHLFMKADIKRYLGDFQESLKCLSNLPEGFTWKAEMENEIKKKNTKVFGIE